VEALLRNIELTADEHKCQPADVTFEVEGDTLYALCRRWLAVEDAEVAHVEPKNGLAVMHERCVPLALMGQRVRLVPEAGQGGEHG